MTCNAPQPLSTSFTIPSLQQMAFAMWNELDLTVWEQLLWRMTLAPCRLSTGSDISISHVFKTTVALAHEAVRQWAFALSGFHAGTSTLAAVDRAATVFWTLHVSHAGMCTLFEALRLRDRFQALDSASSTTKLCLIT